MSERFFVEYDKIKYMLGGGGYTNNERGTRYRDLIKKAEK